MTGRGEEEAERESERCVDIGWDVILLRRYTQNFDYRKAAWPPEISGVFPLTQPEVIDTKVSYKAMGGTGGLAS